MSDTLALVLTGLLAVATLGWGVWSMWHTARRTPTRQRALTHLFVVLSGTSLLGVLLPALLLGAIDPFPVWLVYAALAVGAAMVLGWRWPTLKPAATTSPSPSPSLMIAACLLLVTLAMGCVAVF